MKQPNFLFILIDDLGWHDVGYNGSTFYDTPHIDQLAGESVRFDSAYSPSPMCSPARASIITGKCPPRHGITQYIPGWRSSRFKYISPLTGKTLSDEEFTLGSAFCEAGYHTAFMGKWHVGDLEEHGPEQYGFATTKAVIEINGCRMPYPFGKMAGCFEDANEGDYFTDKLTDEAISFLQAQQNSDEPFLLFLSHFAMHAPIEAKEEDRWLYEEKAKRLSKLAEGEDGVIDPYSHKPVKKRQDDPEYAGELKNLDENIGRLMQALKAYGLEDDTVVIFTSDNGGRTALNFHEHPTSVQPLRGGKTFVFEGGIRIPLLVRWPDVTLPGSSCETPVMSMDFYPTMLEMAGLPLREDQHKDGHSLVPLLKGDDLQRQYLYWHFPHYQGEGAYPASAVRYEDHKLIRNYHFEDYQLFNVVDDPYETRDLIAQEPELVQRLKTALAEWFDEVGAELPVKNNRTDIIDEISEQYRDI